MNRHIFVTGGSQGIGLEFTRQFLQLGERVYTGSRKPEKSLGLQSLKEEFGDHLVSFQLDVGEEEARSSLKRSLHGYTSHIDLLINNAGILSGNEKSMEAFGDITQEDLSRTFLVNSIAPLMMVQGLLPYLAESPNAVVVNITSDNGSISMRRSGGKYGYCASKAALNMMTKILSFDLKDHGIIVIALHPGWVQTPMTRFEDAPLSPLESVQGMIGVIDSLRLEDSGKFLDWRRKDVHW